MKLLLLVLTAALLGVTHAQEATTYCSGKLDTASCKTFRKILAAKQPDLLSMFAGETYVCFREDEDTFFVISFHAPQVSTAGEVPGSLAYHRFKQGISDDFRKIAGDWKTRDNQPTFTSAADNKLPPVEQTRAEVNHLSIVVSYSFLNHEKAEVQYKLQLRRAELDYLEDYRWQNPKTSKTVSSHYSGQCIESKSQ